MALHCLLYHCQAVGPWPSVALRVSQFWQHRGLPLTPDIFAAWFPHALGVADSETRRAWAHSPVFSFAAIAAAGVEPAALLAQRVLAAIQLVAWSGRPDLALVLWTAWVQAAGESRPAAPMQPLANVSPVSGSDFRAPQAVSAADVSEPGESDLVFGLQVRVQRHGSVLVVAMLQTILDGLASLAGSATAHALPATVVAGIAKQVWGTVLAVWQQAHAAVRRPPSTRRSGASASTPATIVSVDELAVAAATTLRALVAADQWTDVPDVWNGWLPLAVREPPAHRSQPSGEDLVLAPVHVLLAAHLHRRDLAGAHRVWQSLRRLRVAPSPTTWRVLRRGVLLADEWRQVQAVDVSGASQAASRSGTADDARVHTAVGPSGTVAASDQSAPA